MNSDFTIDDARDALHAIDPGCGRDEWHAIGRAAIASGLSVDEIDDWSKDAPNYSGTRDVRAAFKTITPDGGTGPRTLFRKARDAGWVPPKNGDRPKAQAKAPTKPVEPSRKPAPGASLAEVLGRSDAATSRHEYIRTKAADSVSLENLRVLPADDPLHIKGEPMAGALVVPAYAPDGTLQSLQLISPKGKKMNLPGSPMSGASFTVGELELGGTAYLCEGIGTAWACWQATGLAAVVCFGWSNVGRVAAQLRERDATGKLVLVPDAGKEAEADKMAADVGAAVARMPSGSPNNYDAGDYLKDTSTEDLRGLLESATEPPRPGPTLHPLARFVDFDGSAQAPRWVIPGFIGHGVVVIAGAHGVGKTSALLPLAMTAAGLHGDQLAPRHWRHVVYVTEDVEQVRRILAGIVGYGNLNISLESVRERVHIVEAIRLDPAYVAQAGKPYREQFTRTVGGVEVLPLVVIDTKSAVLALESENDNSEASAMMAALKQGFDGLPVWLIGHVAKVNLSRSDVSALSSRGASAIEGDANQTMFLVREGDARYLVLGKTRFEPRWPELAITSYTAQTTAKDEFGHSETIVMRWGLAAPADTSRKEAAEQATEVARKEDAATLRQGIRDAIETAWQTGHPLNREGVKAKLRHKTAIVVAALENLLSEGWVHEIAVPSKERIHPRKAAFLVNLTPAEHEAFLRGEGLPTAKTLTPKSWKKQPTLSIPAPEGECLATEGVQDD